MPEADPETLALPSTTARRPVAVEIACAPVSLARPSPLFTDKLDELGIPWEVQ